LSHTHGELSAFQHFSLSALFVSGSVGRALCGR
jgi:hypothetical protein